LLGKRIIRGAMKYAYWIAKCKTPDCPTHHLAKFIGFHDVQSLYVLPDEMPGWFDFQCDRCYKVHRYMRDDLSATALDFPPPGSWPQWW
jgi:hypothetical protein